MTKRPKEFANGGYVGRSNYSGFREFHEADRLLLMTEEERERVSKAFQAFIATVQENERNKKLKQEEQHGDH